MNENDKYLELESRFNAYSLCIVKSLNDFDFDGFADRFVQRYMQSDSADKIILWQRFCDSLYVVLGSRVCHCLAKMVECRIEQERIMKECENEFNNED